MSGALSVMDQTRADVTMRRVVVVAKHTEGDAAEHSLRTGTCPTPSGEGLYAAAGEAVYEVKRQERRPSSWFIRSTVVREGGLWTLTPCDVTLLLMNVLCTRDARTVLPAADLLEGYPLLSRHAARLSLICTVHTEGDERFYELSTARCLAYARIKLARLLSCDVLHKWYSDAAGAAAAAPSEKEKTVQVLHLLHEYIPKTIFDKLCISMDVPVSEFHRLQGVSERHFQASFVERDVDLKRKREEDEEDKKKRALSTASMAVKRTMKQGVPKGNMSIMSFFKKK